MLYLISLPQKYTSRIVLQNSELTAKYQHPLVQIGQKIPEGLVLQMGVPVKNKLSVFWKIFFYFPPHLHTISFILSKNGTNLHAIYQNCMQMSEIVCK